MMYYEQRKDLCRIVKTMYDRNGTNAAGGNVSVRVSDEHIIMTPTLMSQDHLCDLVPEQIIVVDMNEEIVEGDGEKTREINMHMGLYRLDKEINSVLHGHAKESMVFAAQGMDMPNITEATHKLGPIKCLEFAPACSEQLASNVVNHFRGFDNRNARAALLNRHGVIITESSLHKAYDILERLEYNAYAAYKALVFDKLGIQGLSNEEHDYNVEE